jgi:hypothetical protein
MIAGNPVIEKDTTASRIEIGAVPFLERSGRTIPPAD